MLGGGSPAFALCLSIGILGLQRHTLAPRFPWVLILVQQAHNALSRLPVLPLVALVVPLESSAFLYLVSCSGH